MSVATVQTFYALLAIVAMVAIVAVVGLRVLAIVSVGGRDAYDGVARAIRPNVLGLAWFVALAATAGSLYFSEVAGFTPCTLCWYQRIAMYPLVIILAIGAARRDKAVAWSAGALAAIGALIAGYHVALEWIPSLDTGACAAAAPCTFVWFRVFGFISLPTLALTAFLLILTLLAVRPSDEPSTDDASRSLP